MSTTREALEDALAADPDDVAAHSAYADLLIEAGDPRGEYIRLQLALEDRNQPADRLRAMEQEAFALRREHEAEWLGPLAEFVLPQQGPSIGAMVAEPGLEVTWRRGWVHGVRVRRLTQGIANAAWEAVLILRLLAEIGIRSVGEMRYGDLRRFVRSHERILNKLELGDPDSLESISLYPDSDLPRLEYLTLHGVRSEWLARMLTRSWRALRELEATALDAVFPLGLLAANATLGRLRRLHFDETGQEARLASGDDVRTFCRSPHLRSLEYLALRLPGFGDAGVDELISSGMITRLKGLDLCRCEITDDGAQELAACPDVARLEYLHLDNNLLSPVGIEALAAVGVTVSDRQLYGGWDAAGET